MNRHERRQMRWMLFGLQRGRCFYCRDYMVLSHDPRRRPHPKAATLEHLPNRATGVDEVPQRLVAACADCNSRRQDRTWQEWRAERSGWQTT